MVDSLGDVVVDSAGNDTVVTSLANYVLPSVISERERLYHAGVMARVIADADRAAGCGQLFGDLKEQRGEEAICGVGPEVAASDRCGLVVVADVVPDRGVEAEASESGERILGQQPVNPADTRRHRKAAGDLFSAPGR